MGDLIFLIIPLLLGGVLARLNSKVVAENIETTEKWFAAQTIAVGEKTGIGYRIVLLPILKGFNKAFAQINTFKSRGMRSGAVVAFLIYAVLLVTTILSMAIYYFLYTSILLAVVCPVIWFLDKRGIFIKYPNKEFQKTKLTSSSHVIDLNKVDDGEFSEEDSTIEINDLDEFGLKKKR